MAALRGVALSFLVSITLLPALLLTFEGKLTWKTLNLENIVANIAASVEKAVVPLFAVLLIVLILGFWGGSRTEITYANDVFIPSQLTSMKVQQEYKRSSRTTIHGWCYLTKTQITPSPSSNQQAQFSAKCA